MASELAKHEIFSPCGLALCEIISLLFKSK